MRSGTRPEEPPTAFALIVVASRRGMIWMPELPEVEAARRTAEQVLAGRCIEQVEVADDHVVYDRASPEEVRSALLDRTVRAARRKGKYFWLVLDRPPYPVFHFGMSGRL